MKVSHYVLNHKIVYGYLYTLYITGQDKSFRYVEVTASVKHDAAYQAMFQEINLRAGIYLLLK